MFFIPFIGFSVSTPTENYGKVIYSYAITLLDEVMKENEAIVAAEDGERFTTIYIETFLRSSGSFYTAKRHARTLAEALPLLKDRVNICDLVTVTGIKIFYPKLYEVIKANGDLLAGPLSEETYTEHQRQLQELRSQLDAIIARYDEDSDNGGSIRGMLLLLFPRLDAIYRGLLQTEENYRQCVEKKRICSDEHVALFFSVPYVTP